MRTDRRAVPGAGVEGRGRTRRPGGSGGVRGEELVTSRVAHRRRAEAYAAPAPARTTAGTRITGSGAGFATIGKIATTTSRPAAAPAAPSFRALRWSSSRRQAGTARRHGAMIRSALRIARVDGERFSV